MIQTQQVLNSIIKLTAITVYVDSSIASCDEKLLYMELISVVHCEIGGTKTTNFTLQYIWNITLETGHF